MLTINSAIESLLKLTKPQFAALKKLKIFCIRDMLLHFPYRYLDFSQVKKISELNTQELASIRCKINSITSRFSFKGRINLAEGLVSDNTGSLKVVWFNQGYLAKNLIKGEEIFLSGRPEIYNGNLQFTNPIYEKASDFPVHTSRLLPLYHLSSKLHNKTIRNFIVKTLSFVNEVLDQIPTEILTNLQLPSLSETIKKAHFPNTVADTIIAKKRLAFNEIFINQLAAQKHKLERAEKQSFYIKFDQKLIKEFVNSLPFSLTTEQKKAAWDILQDLEKPVAMNRLLEGDVGSGKTLVALIASLQTAHAGLQVVFLAPTEILAKQHFETANKFLDSSIKNKNLKILLLTNTYSQINSVTIPKAELQKLIAEGVPGIYIGTHALLQKQVKFSKLALVIIDEQHRFGVEQRSALFYNTNKVPHLLSLSATPIPRTLQLAFFGELNISQIRKKPADRKPVTTRVVDEHTRIKAYNFIETQILLGRQIFVITPLIEETDNQGIKSAKSEIQKLKKIFSRFEIGLLHGKLKSNEKERVMTDFLKNKLQILIATSVVEVGVDVPNASVIIIEGAERFGLAQLHQFRGRVGRAGHQSYCILFPSLTFQTDSNTKKRLELFSKTQNGFELAEMDLKMRGFGEMYGSEQSGWNFKYFDVTYTDLIDPARKAAQQLLLRDRELEHHLLLKQQIQNKTIHFE